MKMNNIKNTMCRLADLTRGQANTLVAAMPDSHDFDFGNYECFIGFTLYGTAGTWRNANDPKIISYTEMMQLLGATDMNKKTAQEQLSAMQVEMDKLKVIINTLEVKTGRVMRVEDLEMGVNYWSVADRTSTSFYMRDKIDIRRIETGSAFYDKETAEKHLEYLKLEQELRIAQAADGGAGINAILLTKSGSLKNDPSTCYHEKISFKTHTARNAFRTAHTDEQLKLLIRGV
jgi:hypothetical protein